jgi:uncharacterized protein YjhX (UPF0386 family)
MDISRDEQRVLHALAQGGHILPIRTAAGRIAGAECYTRDGWLLPGLTLRLFQKLRGRKAIASQDGGPYRVTRRGLELVRSQPDNR